MGDETGVEEEEEARRQRPRAARAEGTKGEGVDGRRTLAGFIACRVGGARLCWAGSAHPDEQVREEKCLGNEKAPACDKDDRGCRETLGNIVTNQETLSREVSR